MSLIGNLCPDCDAPPFETSTRLAIHRARMHDLPLYQCPSCAGWFDSPSVCSDGAQTVPMTLAGAIRLDEPRP